MLCLCKTLGQNRLAAPLLLVRSRRLVVAGADGRFKRKGAVRTTTGACRGARSGTLADGCGAVRADRSAVSGSGRAHAHSAEFGEALN
jgi:hypothetical protein